METVVNNNTLSSEDISVQIISFLDNSIKSFNIILELNSNDIDVQEAIRIAAGNFIEIYKSNMKEYEKSINSISDRNIIDSINKKKEQMYILMGKVVMKYDITIKDEKLKIK